MTGPTKMLRWTSAWTVTAALAGVALGQGDARPDQLQKRYDDTVAQLKQAQDRKNELAADNERLTARLADVQKRDAELQRQLDAVRAERDDLNRQVQGSDEKTFFLRSHYAAWKLFVATDARLKQRWDTYLRGDATATRERSDLIDLAWPFASEE